jgi:DNA-binding MarR family transcriptional regulator
MQNVQCVARPLAPGAQPPIHQARPLQPQSAKAADPARAGNDPVTALAEAHGAATLARRIIRARHQRSRFLPSKLFSDPAWDILLALYAAEVGQRRITVGQLCGAAEIPATTGLRWLGTLEEMGLVARRADPLDARRFFVSLTEAGREGMSGYLQTMQDLVLAA